MLFLWNLLLAIGWPLMYFYRPFRGSIGARLGRFDLQRYDPQRQGLRVVINAVSAGEVAAIAPFIAALRELRPDAQVALLTNTDSGIELARKRLGESVECVAYFPLLDLPWASRRYLDRLRPQLYITTESELWPNIQAQCRARGAPVVLLNARLYLHNKRGWRRVLHSRLLALCDLIVCQSDAQRENFCHFGIADSKLAVSGNIKFDYELPQWSESQLTEWRQRLGIGAGPVIVAGSTHEGEEELILRSIKEPVAAASSRLDPASETAAGMPPPQEVRTPVVIFAPRHIDRAPEVAALCTQRGLRAVTLSEAEAHQPAWDGLVVDRYGALVDCYRLADVVIIGGTFHAKVGGHNLLEATALGKPVICGPHVYSIAAQVEQLEAANAIVRVSEGSQLSHAVSRLLSDPARARAIGATAKQVTQSNRGAAKRAVELVLALPGS